MRILITIDKVDTLPLLLSSSLSLSLLPYSSSSVDSFLVNNLFFTFIRHSFCLLVGNYLLKQDQEEITGSINFIRVHAFLCK
ncbi:unnamed protein product [Schistosoma rodhaini]|nr:unnamed protein product [Schistosoma rodhaini]